MNVSKLLEFCVHTGNLTDSKKVTITQILPFRHGRDVLNFGGGRFGGWFYLTYVVLILIQVFIQLIRQYYYDINGINRYAIWMM
jgi:hypothetical protein